MAVGGTVTGEGGATWANRWRLWGWVTGVGVEDGGSRNLGLVNMAHLLGQLSFYCWNGLLFKTYLISRAPIRG